MISMDNFWNDLSAALARTDGMDPKAAEAMMSEFLDDHRGLWPHIAVDIAESAEHRELLRGALSLAHGEATPATISQTEIEIYATRMADLEELREKIAPVDYEALERRAQQIKGERIAQAQKLLDLFEGAQGRPARSAAELAQWASRCWDLIPIPF